jgi:hypothetical protein
MIGVIGPLVQGKRELRGSVGSVALFGVGAIAGALVTGSLIGLLGAALQALAGERTLALAVGAAGCGLVLVDVALRTPTLRRQTCSAWYRDRGARKAWVFWGFDLGLGFSTIRLSSLYWLTALFVAAFVSPLLAPLVLAFYGLGLTVAFAGAVIATTRSTSPAHGSPGVGLLHAAAPVRVASVAFLGVVSLLIVTSVAWS